MHLLVKLPNEYKKISELEVGDTVLCDGGEYLPVKNIVYISCKPTFCRTSNNLRMYLSERMQLKTAKGFKHPELWDVLPLSEELTPMLTTVKILDRVMIFRDILIDGNMVTVDGVVFRYFDQRNLDGKEAG
jgi:hypothetical protein